MNRRLEPPGPAPGPLRLPPQPIGTDVLREKYLQPGEGSVEAIYDRVARALASAEKPALRAEWARRFRRNLEAGAIGAGRIMHAAGTASQATWISCFVQPVGDGVWGTDEQGEPGLYHALREVRETLRRGGGVGCDFSRIRPRGARVQGRASSAPGPCRCIDLFDRIGTRLERAGGRRGAQMGVLRIDHPDVIDFITAKRQPGRWRHFNVSVGVSDGFMHALQQDADWALVHPAEAMSVSHSRRAGSVR